MSKELEFKFDSSQDFQLKAISSVVELFEGQPIASGSSSSVLSTMISGLGIMFENGIISNSIVNDVPILSNLQKIQEENGVGVSEQLEACEVEESSVALNFTIEMETGTGKTYTYIRTCYELNKVYGFKKFVIVVPSVPIR